jgi:Flavin containing amine oxidoreductase
MVGGLAAARELRDRDVHVLEASGRVGGRLWPEPRSPIELNRVDHGVVRTVRSHAEASPAQAEAARRAPTHRRNTAGKVHRSTALQSTRPPLTASVVAVRRSTGYAPFTICFNSRRWPHRSAAMRAFSPSPFVTLCSGSRLHGPTLRESSPDGRGGRRPTGQPSAGSSGPLCRRHERALRMLGSPYIPGARTALCDRLKYAGHAGYRAVGAHDGRNAEGRDKSAK